MKTSVVLSSIASALLAAPWVMAQPAPAVDIEAEHRRGQQLFRLHQDAEARSVFEGLVQRTHEPRALARLAATEAALGDWLSAEGHLREALAADTDRWIQSNRRGADGGLEGDLQRYQSHVGRLEVLSTTPGAEVSVADAPSVSLPMREPLRVLAGAVTFEVRAAGYLPEVRREEVSGGAEALTRVSVALHPRPAVAVVRAAPPAVQVVPVSTRASLAAPAAVVLGFSGVSIAVGVTALVLRNGHAGAFNDDPRCGVRDGTVTGAEPCQSEYDAGTSLQTLSVAGFAVGGALLVGGVTLLLLSPSRGARVTPTAGAGDVGIGLRATF